MPGPFDAAYQGAPGAFSEDAAIAFVGSRARFAPCRTLDDVVHVVISGQAQTAVVPVENTIAGIVPRAAELINRHGLAIKGEHWLRIAHALIAPPGATLDAVQRVRSHPVALRQCERFLSRYPSMVAVPDWDTAGAARDVVRRREPGGAAVASRRAAAVYGGVVLADDIQDRPDNFTRFVWLSRSVDQ